MMIVLLSIQLDDCCEIREERLTINDGELYYL